MKNGWYAIAFLSLLIACRNTNTGFKKGSGGLEYKVISQESVGDPVAYGQYLKLAVTQVYGDTMLRNPAKTGYEYQPMDSGYLSPDALMVFRNARVGDSLVFRVPADSAFKRSLPDFARRKKAPWLETRVKVFAILPDADHVKIDKQQETGQPAE